KDNGREGNLNLASEIMSDCFNIEPQAHSYMMEADYTYQSRLTRTEGCPIVGFERRSFESRPTRRSTKPVSNELPESSSARIGNTRYIRSDLPQSNYIRSEAPAYPFFFLKRQNSLFIAMKRVRYWNIGLLHYGATPNAYLWKANGFEGQAKALHRLANGLIQRAVALHRLSVRGNSRRTKNDRVKYEWDAKQGLVGNLKSSCTDIAKSQENSQNQSNTDTGTDRMYKSRDNAFKIQVLRCKLAKENVTRLSHWLKPPKGLTRKIWKEAYEDMEFCTKISAKEAQVL
ncbi:hypothetical protein Tco_1138894, partial [Tanacetum coccineum]